MKLIPLICSSLLIAGLSGCSSGRNIVTGNPRPAISPSSVVIYPAPPQRYEVIAIVMSEAGGKGQGATDKAIKRLKERAAHLGANGLLIENINVNKHYATYYGMPVAPAPSETGISGTAIYVAP